MKQIVMPCEEWVEKFAAFHLEDFSERDQQAFQKHLKECHKCAAVYEAYNVLDNRIRAQMSASIQFEQLPDLLPFLEDKEVEKPTQLKRQIRVEQFSIEKNGLAASNISLRVRFPTKWSEIELDKVDLAECIIEEIAALVLIEIFDTVWMDDVSITFPAPPSRREEIAASICAQGFDPHPSVDFHQLDCIVEDRLTQALAELFGVLYVERCAIL